METSLDLHTVCTNTHAAGGVLVSLLFRELHALTDAWVGGGGLGFVSYSIRTGLSKKEKVVARFRE